MIKRFGIVLMLMTLAGCLGGTRPAPLIRQHVLDYVPPQMVQRTPFPDVLLMERFTANRLCAGTEMVFSEGSFQQGVYRGQRWRVAPADMVADFLRRDLRAGSLFKAVLHDRDLDEPRLVLQGGVEAFREQGEGKERKALLVATLTLLDLSRRGIQEQLLFQKTFQVESPVTQPGASGLAEAMSRAMPRFSLEVAAEIARVLNPPGR